MNTKNTIRWMVFIALAIMLGACSLPKPSGDPAADTTSQPLPKLPPMVSAAGEIVPEQTALLSVSAGGVVETVLVNEGDFVTAGQVLVQLEGTEQQLAAVSSAELALANAQFNLDTLYKDTNLLAAQALKSAEVAERALEDLHNRELQQALALQAIADAHKAIEDTERTYNFTTNSADQADIDAQKAQVVLVEDALEKAIEDFEPYEGKSETNLSRANFLAKKAAAQQVYDTAVRRLNALLGTGSEADIAVAEANYLTAQAQLVQAERDMERVMDGPDAGEVALLEAQIEKGFRDSKTYSAGPDPDDVTLAQTHVKNAEAQLAAAQATLADLELVAPFDGVIAAVHINPSEWVAPGIPVLLIADLENLQVETTDLGEIDVAQISVGDIAVITLDALPDLVLEGTVVSIAPKSDQGSGVNYTVILELNEVHPELRWGMTAFVDVDLE